VRGLKGTGAFALVLSALIAGCGIQQPSNPTANRANRPSEGFQGQAPNQAQAAHKYGAKPGLREYRVHSDLVLNLGKGVTGSVNGNDYHKCVNANGGFAFTTASDEEKHDLWIDASTSFPLCWQDASLQDFDVHVTSPYKAAYSGVLLFQDQAGSAYHLECNGTPFQGLACTKTGPLSAKITRMTRAKSGAKR
jgi:hypothetical protein